MYFTIQFKHPHRGSIDHQSSTDKKRNSLFLLFLLFFLPFLGFLKKKTGLVRAGGGLWRVRGFSPWMRGTGSSKAGRNIKHIWRRGDLLRVLSLFFSFFDFFLFYEEHFVQPHLTTFSTSWTKEEPSVHWKVYFLRLLRRGVQQVPCPSAPPGQLPRHSRRETFSWVWHAV